MHDLVIRHGVVADGRGGPLTDADVAVDGDRITAVGPGLGAGREEIDASDLVVTPGFVDPHTHYDGQATWDPLLTPSIWHGVTTVVMGNCGVGFAPAAPDRREWLIGLMEGVEDIPGAALREAIRWDWGSVAEYLSALERLPRAIDVGVQIAHGAVRAYVMGERGAANEAPTPARLGADGRDRRGGHRRWGARLLDQSPAAAHGGRWASRTGDVRRRTRSCSRLDGRCGPDPGRAMRCSRRSFRRPPDTTSTRGPASWTG